WARIPHLRQGTGDAAAYVRGPTLTSPGPDTGLPTALAQLRPRPRASSRPPFLPASSSSSDNLGHSVTGASRRILLRSPLVRFLERLLALRAATGPGSPGGGCGGVSPSALFQRLFPIGGGELNFKLMDLIPLGVSALALRYRQKVL